VRELNRANRRAEVLGLTETPGMRRI
jgi:hypothetical protein